MSRASANRSADASHATEVSVRVETPRVETGKIEPALAMAGAIIAYREKTVLKHVGIVQEDGRVGSKWGHTFLMRHGKTELPWSYGTELSYFRKPDTALAWNWLRAYRAA